MSSLLATSTLEVGLLDGRLNGRNLCIRKWRDKHKSVSSSNDDLSNGWIWAVTKVSSVKALAWLLLFMRQDQKGYVMTGSNLSNLDPQRGGPCIWTG